MYLFYFYQLTDIIMQSSLEICLIFYKGSAYVSWHQLFPTTIDTHSLLHTSAAKWGIPPNVAASYYTEVSVSWGRERRRRQRETGRGVKRRYLQSPVSTLQHHNPWAESKRGSGVKAKTGNEADGCLFKIETRPDPISAVNRKLQ